MSRTTQLSMVLRTAVAFLTTQCLLVADDWPMFGRTPTRNPVVTTGNAPTDWNAGRFDRRTGEWDLSVLRNIKWRAELGTIAFGDAIVAGGLVWVGTNNRPPRDPDFTDERATVLMCFRETDGKFLYQYGCQPLPDHPYHWHVTGHTSSPLAEEDRLWFTTIRGEVVCLDVGPLQRGEGKPQELWKYDMVGELGVFPRGASMGDGKTCSVASYGNRLYVITGNGVERFKEADTAPDAPSLICLDKLDGRLLWEDSTPDRNILSGQWSSPLVAEIDGKVQCLAPQGDGWLRSFDSETGRLLWEFDINSKAARWHGHGPGNRNFFMTAPVLYQGRIYIASGQNMLAGSGPGRLVCLDPTRTGDISSELAVDEKGKRLPHRRVQAVDPKKGEAAVPNPDSGLLWEFTHRGEQFEDVMHRSKSTVAIARGLVIAPDMDGAIHCLDAETGKKYWAYDAFGQVHGSPLIVDGRIYVADADGDVEILALAKRFRWIGEPHLPGGIYSSPIFANGTLYVAGRSTLYAIAREQQQGDEASGEKTDSYRHSSEVKSDEPARRLRTGKDRAPDALFVPTPQDVTEEMLRLAKVDKGDVVYDLGSGDGRVVITAAEQYGTKAVGVEIDRELVTVSQKKVRDQKLEKLVRIEHEDMFLIDLSDATVVTMYLYPRLMERLIPQLNKMKPGSRIVSHHFTMLNVQPEKTIEVKSTEGGDDHTIYLWTVPLPTGSDSGQR